MQYGLFDHIDLAGDRPLAQQYDERLELVAAADEAGYFAYHVAEHHATPLNTIPQPGVFLGAVARLTKRIRMGPMVYLLPLYSPLRLVEEISILDNLSHGRATVGVGRGVSPYELNFQGVDASKSREIFVDAFDCMLTGLTNDRLTYHGPYYNYDDIPMILHPLQKPYPAMWYGSSNTTGAAWAGERGLHFVSNGGTEKAKVNIDAYREALAKRGGGVDRPLPEFPNGAIGVSREVVVADTDAEALRIAGPAHAHIYSNQMYLRREAARRDDMKGLPAYTDPHQSDAVENAIKEGSTIAGSPETVRAQIEAQIERLGINYLICYFMFGTMKLSDALHSLELFTKEVRPKVRTGTGAAAKI